LELKIGTMDEIAERLTVDEAGEWAQYFKERDEAEKKARQEAKSKGRRR